MGKWRMANLSFAGVMSGARGLREARGIIH
jgi:hypothetical protein